VSPERLVHHELCFGCGRTNLFGLLMELEQAARGQVRGRGFVKQDHQGPVRGVAHPGIVAAALSEAMAFATGSESEAEAIQFQLQSAVPVGTFLEVEAQALRGASGVLEAIATARVDGEQVASANGTYRRR
jgi:acyl-coenzyme A thioesterase PaaI-like protein